MSEQKFLLSYFENLQKLMPKENYINDLINVKEI